MDQLRAHHEAKMAAVSQDQDRKSSLHQTSCKKMNEERKYQRCSLHNAMERIEMEPRYWKFMFKKTLSLHVARGEMTEADMKMILNGK